MPDLARHPKDRFSHDIPQMLFLLPKVSDKLYKLCYGSFTLAVQKAIHSLQKERSVSLN